MAKGRTFLQMQEDTMPYGWNDVLLLLKEKRIKLVVLDIVPGETLPFSGEYLRHHGYIPQRKFGWYIVWAPGKSENT